MAFLFQQALAALLGVHLVLLLNLSFVVVVSVLKFIFSWGFLFVMFVNHFEKQAENDS